MQKIELQCNSRVIQGKKVKLLRQQNITPLSLYGHGLKSMSLQCDTAGLERLLSTARDTRLIMLKVDNEKKTKPVLVREIQRETITGKLLHVDLYQVRMDEKVEVQIPIVLVGEASALKVRGNSIRQELNALTIQSLPDKIPDKIEVNISSLSESGIVMRVKDIVVNPDITVLDNLEQVVVTIIAHVEEEAVPKEIPVVTPEEPKQA